MSHPFFKTTNRPWAYPLLVSPAAIENPLFVRPTLTGTAGAFAVSEYPFTPTISAAVSASVSNGRVTNDDISSNDARYGAAFSVECDRPIYWINAIYGGNASYSKTLEYRNLPLHIDPTTQAATEYGYYSAFTGPFTTARRLPYASSYDRAYFSYAGITAAPFLCVRRTASGSNPSFSVPVTMDIAVTSYGTIEYGVAANIVWGVTDGMPIGEGFTRGAYDPAGYIGIGNVHPRKMQISGFQFRDIKNAFVTPSDTRLLATSSFNWSLSGNVSNYIYGPSGSLVFDVSMSIDFSYS